MRTRIAFACLFSLSAILLSSCLERPGRSPDELRLVFINDPQTLDPAMSTDVASGRAIALLYSTLVIYDESARIKPELAKSWTISKDGLVYTFSLREDAFFPAGNPVTAGHVRDSFERVLDPRTKSPRTWVFDRLVGAKDFMRGKTPHVSGIKVIDPHTISLRLGRPFAPFLGFLAMPTASVVDVAAAVRAGGDFARQAFGSGPFLLESWILDKELVFRRNPRAYGEKPGLARIVYRVMNEPTTYTTEFKVGNLDAIPLPFGDAPFFTSHPVWKDHILQQAALNVYFIGLNCQRKPCSDIRVRRAICHAIDADLIVNTTRKGQAVRAYGPIPPGLSGYDPSFRGIKYDPDKARALLAEAGFRDGLSVELLQDPRNENLEVTQLVVSSLARVGIKVKTTPYEWNVFTSKINDGKFDLFYRSWWADYADAENFLYPLYHSSQAGSGGNRPRFSSPEIDSLIEKAQATVDLDERVRLYRTIQKKVVDAAPYAILFHKLERMVVQPWVKGFRLYPVFNSAKQTHVVLDAGALGRR